MSKPKYFKKTLSNLRIKLGKKQQNEAEEKLVELFKILLDMHK